MKNHVVIFVIVIVIAVLGIGAFVFSQQSTQSDSMMKKDEVMMRKDNSPIETTENTVMDGKIINSRYLEYSKTALDGAVSNRRVLFFYASWCPTCRPADISFTQNSGKIPEDVVLIRVNYNDPETDQEEKDLAKKYGITYQHTFVQIDATGKEVIKWNGGQINELLTNIK